MKALLYLRRSKAQPRSTAESRSVAEQRAEMVAWAAREGWQIIGEEVDDGRGASRHSKGRRAGLEAVAERIAAGGVDVLVAWEASRLQRDLAVYIRLRDLCAQHRVLWAYSGQIYDLTARDGRFRTGLDALLAEDETERTRDRILRSVNANAAAGRPHGRKVFGYRRTYDAASGALIGQEADPVESAIVREIVERVAGGTSLRGLARELDGRGVVSPAGKRWLASTVKRIAVNPTYAAVRTHLGVEIPASWAPIVDRAIIDAAAARLAQNDGGRTGPSSEARHLLSGLVTCGVCGARMYFAPSSRHKSMASYRCTGGSGTHLTISEASTDRFVIDTVAAYLGRDDVERMITAAAGNADTSAKQHLAEATALRRRLDDAAEAFAAGHLSAAMLGRVERDLQPLIDDAEQQARRMALPTAVTSALGKDFRAMKLPQQREIIRALLNIKIARASQRGSQFDSRRIEITIRV